MTVIVVIAAVYIHGTYRGISETDNGNTAIYRELKKYEQELKEDITLLNEELADKKAYLASLDEKYAELEKQYNKLLEEKKKIDDRLEAIKATDER